MENKKLDQENLENVTGGNDYLTNINAYYGVGIVGNLPSGQFLALCNEPGGSPIYGATFMNGEQISIHREYTKNGWRYANKSGIFGYVNPQYIVQYYL